MAYVPPVGQTTDPDIFLDNVKLADRLVNGPESTIPDRGGVPLDSWRQMMAKNDEIRQNLVPLSKQYMTLAAAQADIANIPDGSTTYVRSPDGGTLADEYINNGGTLETTGRVMPSGYAVEQISDTVQRLMTALHVMAEGGTSSGSDVDTSETVQNLMTGFNVLAESINNLSVGNQKNSSGLSGLVSSVQVCTEMLNTLAAEIVTPDGAAQYGYVAFSVPGTVQRW
ncbi:flagellar biosynthesis, cell-distal portion of basal-body rod [Klebsiella michiganensis]|uniref:Flagellar biosynthesis, cell-distal portion of basal-body rod n=1 Tax=Klebsiella michiganensis TaxID=1134687 RepID=A0A7H4MW86_9ENTR|nr:flagellar biosynthesis, cell-distal portion of basal-body rod [Klebsiella michiganensis]